MNESSNKSSKYCLLVDPLRSKLDTIARVRMSMAEEQKQEIAKAIAKCEHPVSHVLELPHWLSSGKPFLICTQCGLSEQGWYCGYKLLKHADDGKRGQVSLEEWCATRTKTVFQSGSVVYS